MEQGANGSSNEASSLRDSLQIEHDTGNILLVSEEYKKARRKEYLSKRDSTKICLYEQFERWRQLKEELDIKTDKELAAFLLDSYLSTRSTVVKSEVNTQTEPQMTQGDLEDRSSPLLTSTPIVSTATTSSTSTSASNHYRQPRKPRSPKRRRRTSDVSSTSERTQGTGVDNMLHKETGKYTK